jgi:hypothetical protein
MLALRSRKFAQGGQEPVYFFGSIVVYEADAEQTAAFLDAEALGQV